MSTVHQVGPVQVVVSSRGIGRGVRIDVSATGTFSIEPAECLELGKLLERVAREADAAEGARCHCGHGPSFHATLASKCRACGCQSWLERRREPT